jgi:ATP-dependent DNA ligase
VGGYTAGNPFYALMMGCYDNSELRYVSRVKAGFNPPLRRELYALLNILETNRCPFANFPKPRRYRRDAGLTEADMEKLPLAETQAGGPNRIHRVDAGRSPAAFELCRAAGR